MTYLWLKLLHVVFATMVGVGAVGGLLVAMRARRSHSVRAVHALMKAHHLFVTSQVIPGAVGSLATGIGLVVWVSFDWTSPWIAGSLTSWVLSLLVGVGLLVPAESGALRECDRQLAAREQEPSAALREYVGGARVWTGEWTTVLLFVLMLGLMVLKPT